MSRLGGAPPSKLRSGLIRKIPFLTAKKEDLSPGIAVHGTITPGFREIYGSDAGFGPFSEKGSFSLGKGNAAPAKEELPALEWD